MISSFGNIRRAALVAAITLGLGACVDAPTWPPQVESVAGASQSLVGLGVTGANVTTFVYSPRLGVTQHLGQHRIVMPAGSVCALDSSYGPATWDEPCEPAEHDIVIVATTWTNPDGHPQVDFQPSMRFVPTADSRQFVKLFLRDKDAENEALARQLSIDWVPFVGATPIDEAATDPTLRLQLMNGMAWRRIKHFSGYMVASGRTAVVDSGETLEGF
jgi:hypothetical protein